MLNGNRFELAFIDMPETRCIGVSIHMTTCTIFKDYAESGLLLPLIPTSHQVPFELMEPV